MQYGSQKNERFNKYLREICKNYWKKRSFLLKYYFISGIISLLFVNKGEK
ncbi:capsular polysaccharide synthesis protein [Streptococcus parasuis]